MMHKATFLSYRPSQIASTAILVAIDLNKVEKANNGSATCRASSKTANDSFDSYAVAGDSMTSPKNNHMHSAEKFATESSQSNCSSTREKFNSMLLMEDYELRI